MGDSTSTGNATSSGPGEGDEPGRPPGLVTRAAVTLGLGVMAAAIAVTAAVAMIAGHSWLGSRTLWGIGLVAAIVICLLWRPNHGLAGGAFLAAVAAAGGGLLVASGLSRDTEGGFDDRVLASDLPPVSVYVAAIGFGLVAVASVVVAVLQTMGPDPIGSRRRRVTVARAGIVIGLLMVTATVPVGSELRSAADRRAEDHDLTVQTYAPAVRHDDEPGPARPSREPAWEAPAYDESFAVPSWDVVLAFADEFPSDVYRLTAISKTSGEELWSYERRSATGAATAVDPEAGRVLLVPDRAAVVVDLTDGSEVVTRRLPGLDDCRRPPPTLYEHRNDHFMSPTASLECVDETGEPRLALLDVATGELLDSTPLPLREPSDDTETPGDCGWGTAAGSAPVLAQAGDGRCRTPTLAVYDAGAGGFGTPVPIEIPTAWSDLPDPLPAFETALAADPIVTGDTVVLSLFWAVDDDDQDASTVPEDDRYVSEVIVLDRDGEMLWRRPDFHDALALTDQGLVAEGEGQLALLSLHDGTTRATSPEIGDETQRLDEPATTDGERLYSLTRAPEDADRSDLIVRDLDDLSILDVHQDFAPPHTVEMHATAGRLILESGLQDVRLIAFEDTDTP